MFLARRAISNACAVNVQDPVDAVTETPFSHQRVYAAVFAILLQIRSRVVGRAMPLPEAACFSRFHSLDFTVSLDCFVVVGLEAL